MIKFLLCVMLSVACLLYAQKPKLGVVSFQEVGNVKEGAGKELAGYICGKLGDAYEIKERLQLSAVLKEKLMEAGAIITDKVVEEEMRKFAVDLLLLGQISRTEGDFCLFLRVCDLAGNINFRTTVQSSSWESLKDRVYLALIENRMVRHPGAGFSLELHFHWVVGISGGIVVLLFVLVLRRRKPQAQGKSQSWQEIVELSQSLERDCAQLQKQESLAGFVSALVSLKQAANTMTGRLESMPLNRREEKFFYFKQEIAGLKQETGYLAGLAQGQNSQAVSGKIAEIMGKIQRMSF